MSINGRFRHYSIDLTSLIITPVLTVPSIIMSITDVYMDNIGLFQTYLTTKYLCIEERYIKRLLKFGQ